jgi:hypothetical protein
VVTESLALALARLDRADHALLDLAFGREIPDAEIGELLGLPAGEIARRKAELVAGLSEAIAAPPEAIERELRGDTETVVRAVPQEPEPEAEPQEPEPEAEPEEPEPEAEPEVPPRDPRVRRRIALAVVPLILMGALITILATTGSDDDDDGSARERPRSERPAKSRPAERSPGEAAPGVRLEPVGAAPRGARGTARIEDGRLALRIRGLRPPADGEAYEIWLYDSVAQAVSLGRFERGTTELDAPLPENARDYRFIDVSAESADDNRNHGGASVLRAPLEPLLR